MQDTLANTINLARAVLQRQFGYQDFREGQAEVIAAALQGRNCIVVMPTGGGKSLCYQLPALLLPGRTIVISPLIALMKDQTAALQSRQITASFINSSIPFEQQKATLSAFLAGHSRILYIAPERFRSSYFVNALKQVPVSLFVVDEAHCISQWGHDFRPDYLRLRDIIQTLNHPPVMALTATATPRIRLDIAEQLGLTHADHFVAGFDRSNLRLSVYRTKTQKSKLAVLDRLLPDASAPGIIYAATRKIVEWLARQLTFRRIRALPYHAGLTADERNRTQDAFMNNQIEVIVATNAFGMGIDKPDIRWVLHYNMPDSIESYYQEIGRAGRDGHASTCALLFTPRDVAIQQYFLEADNPHPELIARLYRYLWQRPARQLEITSQQIAEAIDARHVMAIGTALVKLEKAGHIQLMRPTQAHDAYLIRMLDPEPREALNIDQVELARRAAYDQWKLEQMVDYASTDQCLRRFILSYFGDRKKLDRCGICSNCQSPAQSGQSKLHATHTEMDDLFITHAPSGHALKESLRRHSHTLRSLQRQETSLAPRATPATVLPTIQDMEMARLIVQCVAAMNFRFGQSTIIAVLRGARNQVVKRWRLDQTPFHGRLAYLRQSEIQRVIDRLVASEFLVIQKKQHTYPMIGLTEKGWELIKK